MYDFFNRIINLFVHHNFIMPVPCLLSRRIVLPVGADQPVGIFIFCTVGIFFLPGHWSRYPLQVLTTSRAFHFYRA